MALFLNDLRTELQAQGFQDSTGAEPGAWFIDTQKETPDFAVTLFSEPGAPGTRRISEFPAFSIQVRHRKGQEANEFLRRIFDYLQEFQGSIGSAPEWKVARIQSASTPVQGGRDQSSRIGRWTVSQPYTAIVKFTTLP